MKKGRIIAGLLSVSMIAIMAISTAAALSSTYVVISGPGSVWQFGYDAVMDGTQSIIGYIHVEETPTDEYIALTPKTWSINKNIVTVVFDPADTKPYAGTVDFSKAELLDGDGTVLFTVPEGGGFAWGRFR